MKKLSGVRLEAASHCETPPVVTAERTLDPASMSISHDRRVHDTSRGHVWEAHVPAGVDLGDFYDQSNRMDVLAQDGTVYNLTALPKHAKDEFSLPYWHISSLHGNATLHSDDMVADPSRHVISEYEDNIFAVGYWFYLWRSWVMRGRRIHCMGCMSVVGSDC